MATELPEDRPNLAELSKRLARTHGIPDCEPSKRFCNMLGRLPEPGRQEALRDCGDVLGWRLDPEEVLQGPDPATELLRPPTLEELRKRLQHLVQRERIFEPMLLPALQHYLVESFRVACHPAATSDAIDRDLQHLQNLEEWKKLPLDDRPAGFTDDMIERAIPAVEAKMTERAAQRKVADEMVEIMETEWAKTFGPEYWHDWLKRAAEES